MQHIHTKTVGLIIMSVIIVGGVAFFSGMKYSEAKTATAAQTRASQFGSAGVRGGMRPGATGGFVTGDVLSKDATTLTIKLQNGSSKIVLYAPSTEVSKQATGAMSDIVVGSHVTINGTANADGSVTASMVGIRPSPPSMQPY